VGLQLFALPGPAFHNANHVEARLGAHAFLSLLHQKSSDEGFQVGGDEEHAAQHQPPNPIFEIFIPSPLLGTEMLGACFNSRDRSNCLLLPLSSNFYAQRSTD
jgi:hypothetical protein